MGIVSGMGSFAKEVGGDAWFVQLIIYIYIVADELSELLTDDRTLNHQSLGLIIAMIDGDASSL